jgi:hypothetical protein
MLRSVWRLAVLAGVALLVWIAPARADDFYGINSGGGVFNLAAPERDHHLTAMRAAGLSVVRIDASWVAAEPQAPVDGVHRYEWKTFDGMVTAMAQADLRWYPVLCYSTAWSGAEIGSMMSGPADPSDYAAFVRAFAERYGTGGAFWQAHPELPALPVQSYEIWNEPNYDHFWVDQSDAPERYADLYGASRAAVHAVDPSADAVVGGLIDYGGERFVRRMLAHRPDLRGNVDALGFHPYQQRGGVIATIQRMRATLDEVGGRGIPIELTELGWFVGSRPEAARARLMLRVARAVRDPQLGVTRFIPYVWAGDDYALFNNDATPMLAGAAYAAAIRTVTGPQLQVIGDVAVERLRPPSTRTPARRARPGPLGRR